MLYFGMLCKAMSFMVQERDLYTHFCIPVVKAWDNVHHFCSTCLVFLNPTEVETWCDRHGYDVAHVAPIQDVNTLAKKWYGNHLNPKWVKWTMEEAQTIFEESGMNHPLWALPIADGTF